MNKIYRLTAGVIALLLTLSLLLSCGGMREVPDTSSGTVPATASTGDLLSVPVLTTTTYATTQTEPATVSHPSPDDTEPDSGQPGTTLPIPSTDPTTTTQLPTSKPVTEPEPPAPASPYDALSRNAEYILLYDATAGEILYSTGDDQQIYPASTTKLLMLHYALTMVDESAVFTVGSEINIAPWDSSKANIRVGERYTCADIAAALMLPSGNDAAYVIATHCGRLLAGDETIPASDAVKLFMAGLNDYASSLGLTGTHFVTPDGYHDPAHVTTIGDMLKITLLANEHPLISRMMATDSYQVTDLANGRSQTWTNTNYLILSNSRYFYSYATSGKTGYHSAAGACLVATAEKDGRELVVLIFKCSSKNIRFNDAKNFFELGFSLQGEA